MSLIKRISYAIKQSRPQPGWAVHFGIALGFVAIAMGYMIYGSVGQATASTLILPPVPPPYGADIELTEPSFDRGPLYPAEPKRFLALDSVHISWKLNEIPTDFNLGSGWSVDIYYRKLYDDKADEHTFIANVPWPSGGASFSGSYDWTIPLSAASELSDPNPYDRQIILVLKNLDGKFAGWDQSEAFVILLYEITSPNNNASLAYADMHTVKWRTHLSGSARLYIRIWQNESGSMNSNIPIVSNISEIEYESVEWKVGYAQSRPGDPWQPISKDILLDKRAHLRLIPLDYYGQYPSGYYPGFDYDGEVIDDWTKPFTVVDALVGRVELLPESATVTAGVDIQFAASAYNQNNSLITNNPADFTWTNATLAGIFNETVAGNYTVTAAYEGVSDSSAVTVEPDAVDRVIVFPAGSDVNNPPASAEIKAGEELAFEAIAYDQFNNVIGSDPSRFLWYGTQGRNNNIFLQTSVGAYAVSASFSGTASQPDFMVSVVPNSLIKVITVPTGAIGIEAGADLVFSAEAQDQYSNVIDDVEANFDWQNPDWFTIPGTFNQNLPGAYTATASYTENGNTVVSADVIVTVNAGAVVAVELTPSPTVNVQIGQNLPFVAEALDQYGNVVSHSGSSPFDFTWVGTIASNSNIFNKTIAGNYEATAAYAPADPDVVSQPTTVSVGEFAFSATYFSKAFALTSDTSANLESLEDITITYGAPGTSKATFTLGFFDDNNNPVPPSGQQFTLANVQSGIPYSLEDFQYYTWLKDARKVQFKIDMSTPDYTDANEMPWVESLSLNYTLRTTAEVVIGTLNFVPAGSIQKEVQQGASVEYQIAAVSINNHDEDVQLAIEINDGGTSGVTAIISDPPSGLIGLDPTGQSVEATIQFTANSDAPLANDIPFEVRGAVPGQPDLILSSLNGWLSVTRGGPPGGFSLTIPSDTKNPPPGATIIFNINIARSGDFTEDVLLSHNLDVVASQIIDLDPAKTYFLPQVLLPNQSIVDLHVQIKDVIDPNDLDKDFVFTVTGTARDSGDTATDTATIRVSEGGSEYPAINIAVTAPVEGGRSNDLPLFTFRLYENNETDKTAYTFQETNIEPSGFDSSDKISIELDQGIVQDGVTYVGYMRTNRHLWARSQETLTVDTTSAGHPTYTMAFPRLVAGNISPVSNLNDDIINSLDYGHLVQEWSRVFTTILGDFNNDGVVNSSDLTAILGTGKFFKEGELLN